MHVRPTLAQTVDAKDRNERAQKAVKVFRGMQYGLSAYARAITGNKSIRVEISGGPPRTDGKVIYYRPPIALGDKTPHDRNNCDKRGDTGLLMCVACRLREEVLVNIYHEIAHIAFGSFEETTDLDRRQAINEAIKEWGGKYEEQIRRKFATAPFHVRQSYQGLATIISPFLPYLVNCLEDARVDSSMFAARKGTRKMLTADTLNLIREGIPNADGTMQMWHEAPLNSQASIACYLSGAGYTGWQNLIHPKVAEDMSDPRIVNLLAKLKDATEARDTYLLAFPVLARFRELGYFQLPEDKSESEEETNDKPEPESGDESSEDSESEDSDRGGSGDDSSSESESGDEDGDGEASSDPDVGTDAEQSPDENDNSSAEAGVPETSDREEEGSEGSGEAEGSSEGKAGHGADGEDSREGSDDSREASGAGGSVEGDGETDDPQSEGSGGQEGTEADPSEGEGVDNDSDPNDLSSDPGSHKPDGDSDTNGGEGDRAGDSSGGSNQESNEATDQNGSSPDSRSDQEGRDSLGEGLGGADDTTSFHTGDDDSELDDESREGQEGSRSNSDSYSDASESATDDEGGDDRSDVDSNEGLDSEDGRHLEGVMDLGADGGLGGIEVLPPPEYGTEKDVEAAIGHIHQTSDERPESVMESNVEKDALDVAVIQGMYFETPSTGVVSVEEHQYGPLSPGWLVSPEVTPDLKRYFGIDCDMDIPEKVLGPALLTTRRIFSDNKTSSYERNRRSGRVDARILGRRAWSDDDRLFGKKRLPEKKDYAVLIGIDISSSNRGSSLALVKRSAFAQAELCARVGIKFKIVAHSATAGYTMHLHHIKDWDEPWNSEAKLKLSELVAVGGNLDGHAMEYMRKQLGLVDATDKILLYYTDGKMPAANKEEELEVLQRQIRLCKRDKITLLGVGIRTNSPVRHGLDTVQVDTDSDLKAVVDHLGKRLLRVAR